MHRQLFSHVIALEEASHWKQPSTYQWFIWGKRLQLIRTDCMLVLNEKGMHYHNKCVVQPICTHRHVHTHTTSSQAWSGFTVITRAALWWLSFDYAIKPCHWSSVFVSQGYRSAFAVLRQFCTTSSESHIYYYSLSWQKCFGVHSTCFNSSISQPHLRSSRVW